LGVVGGNLGLLGGNPTTLIAVLWEDADEPYWGMWIVLEFPVDAVLAVAEVVAVAGAGAILPFDENAAWLTPVGLYTLP
jgi:hypothetical protein